MSVARAGENGDLSRPSLTAQPSLQFPKPSLSLPYSGKARPLSTKQERAWNTSNLGLRLAADASAAASASILVSPIICVIDRYWTPSIAFLDMGNRFTDISSVLSSQKLQPAPASPPASGALLCLPCRDHTPSWPPSPSSSSSLSTSAPTSLLIASTLSRRPSGHARPIAYHLAL